MAQIKKLPTSRWKDYRKLRLESLQKDPLAFGSSYKEEKKLTETEWKKRMKNCLFALSKGEPIGMLAVVFPQKEKSSHIANIFGFYVKESHRNEGVGNCLLMNALSRINKNKKIIKIDLTACTEQKAAISLYKKFGFKIIGKLRKDSYENKKFYDAYIMEKFIK